MKDSDLKADVSVAALRVVLMLQVLTLCSSLQL